MKNLDKFGKVIAEDLRDSALNYYLDLESNWLNSPSLRELQSKLQEFTPEQLKTIRQLITTCVDNGVHDFLFALEEKRQEIEVFVDGENVSELSDGLQGEIFSEDGWFSKYSQHKEKGI